MFLSLRVLHAYGVKQTHRSNCARQSVSFRCCFVSFSGTTNRDCFIVARVLVPVEACVASGALYWTKSISLDASGIAPCVPWGPSSSSLMGRVRRARTALPNGQAQRPVSGVSATDIGRGQQSGALLNRVRQRALIRV